MYSGPSTHQWGWGQRGVLHPLGCSGPLDLDRSRTAGRWYGLPPTLRPQDPRGQPLPVLLRGVLLPCGPWFMSVSLYLRQYLIERHTMHHDLWLSLAHFKIKTKLRCLWASGKAWPFFLCVGVTVAVLVVAAGPPPKLRPVAKCHPPQITPIAAPKRKRSLQKRYFHRRYEKLYKCTLYLTLDG